MLLTISRSEYDAIEAVNFSTLKEMEKSPAHFAHRVKFPREDNIQLALGRGAHTALFEPDRFPLDYIIYKGERRGNKWKTFKKNHPNETILKEDEYQQCLRIRDEVRKHTIAKKYLERGTPEATITWVDRATGLPCKARLDFVSDVIAAYLDLKTSSSTNLALFAYQMVRLLYHAQFAFYIDGLAEVGKRVEPLVILAENQEPYKVVVADIDRDTIQLGRALYQGWLRQVVKCRETGIWPGPYDDELQSLRAPEFAFYDDSDEDVTTMDLVIREGA